MSSFPTPQSLIMRSPWLEVAGVSYNASDRNEDHIAVDASAAVAPYPVNLPTTKGEGFEFTVKKVAGAQPVRVYPGDGLIDGKPYITLIDVNDAVTVKGRVGGGYYIVCCFTNLS